MSRFGKHGVRCDWCGIFANNRRGEYVKSDGTAGYIIQPEWERFAEVPPETNHDICKVCEAAELDRRNRRPPVDPRSKTRGTCPFCHLRCPVGRPDAEGRRRCGWHRLPARQALFGRGRDAVCLEDREKPEAVS